MERRIGRCTIRIDRTLCVGFGDCVDVAPAVFALDDDGLARFADPAVDEAAAVAACSACPVDALTAFDDAGRQIAP